MTVGPFVLGSFLVTEGDGLFFLAAVHLLQEVSVQLLVTVSWDYLVVVVGRFGLASIASFSLGSAPLLRDGASNGNVHPRG